MFEQDIDNKKIGGLFDLGNLPHSNLDTSYGPYTTLSEVDLYISEESRGIGLTVGILKFSADNNGDYAYSDNLEDNFTHKIYDTYYKKDNFTQSEDRFSISGIQEYWYQPTSNGELKLEPKRIETKLINIEFTVTYNSSDNSVIVSYSNIQGNSIFAQNSVSIYRDNLLQTVSTFNNEGETFIYNNVSIGRHIYKIQIIDIFGQSITKTAQINVGTVKITKTNFSIPQLNKITSETIKNKSFGIEIEILNEEWGNAEFGIYADDSKVIDLSIDQQNNITISESSAQQMDGHIIYVKGKLANHNDFVEELFKVLGSDVLYVSILNQYLPKFYVNNTTYLNLKFESGAEFFEISSPQQSDFSFKTTTIYFNKNGTVSLNLYITPKEVKENAQLIFSYGSNKTVSLDLGNIIETPTLDRSKDWAEISNIINSNINSIYLDFTGILNPNRDNTNSDQIGDSNIIVKFNDQMYITNNVIHVNGIEVATPLSEKVYIGLGFGLKDINPNIPRNSETGINIIYDCICINGTIVKVSGNNRPSEQRISNWNVDSILNNNYLNINKVGGIPCTGLYYNTSTEDISLFSGDVPKCEINYKWDFEIEEENKIIPTMYLEALGNPQSGQYNTWKSEFHNVSFGNISDGFEKYGDQNIPPSDDNYFKLLKISEPYKSDYQKYYGVVCRYYYTETEDLLPSNINDITPEKGWTTGIVTVYTQGTSTLGYAIPNFKFYFNESFTLKYSDDVNDSISETILTAKADYMESSHLNNTPTAMLYNNIVKDESIITEESPSIQYGGNDAIVGTPIRLMIKDKGSTEYSNYGSFMLNTDKVSDTLGFKVNDSLEEDPIPTCISFEGKSNDPRPDHGLAATFRIDDSDNDLVQAFNDINTLITDSIPIEYWYCDNENGQTININESGTIEYIKDGNNITFVQSTKANYYEKVIKVLNYLSKGFEYRYPDLDMIKSKRIEGTQYKYTVMPFDHFKVFFKMFYKVANSTSETDIDDLVNLDYCYLYIIFLIVFGQSDNLGKNCMFDFWKVNEVWGKCHPRPYDLDSQCGINNGGIESVPPFVQVNRNWIPGGLGSNEDYDEIFNSSYKYKYMTAVSLFGYSSSTSKLWENIYLRHIDEISSKYSLLRANNKELFYDNLINHFEDIIINKIPVHQYNIDFRNKYLGSPQQIFMLGNRWTNFKDWIRARIAFCDGFFRYKNADYQFSRRKDFNLNYAFPAFVITHYGSDSSGYEYSFGENIQMNIADSGSLRYRIYLSDSLVLSTNLYNDLSIQTAESDNFEFSNLEELTLGGKIIPDLLKCNVLTKLTITSTCTTTIINVPDSVQTLICNSTNIQSLNFSENSELRTLYLEGGYDNIGSRNPINFNNGLDLTNCRKLESLTLNKCNIRETLRLPGGKYSFSSTESDYNDITLDSGAEIDNLDLSKQSVGVLNLAGTINRLDLFNTTLTNTTLDLTSVQGINTLNLIKCNVTTVKVGDNTFGNKLKLGVQDSYITTLSKFNGDQAIYDGIDLTILPNDITSIVNCNENATSKHPISAIFDLRYYQEAYEAKTEESSSWNKIEKPGLSLGKTLITKVKVKPGRTAGICLFSQCNQLTTIEKEDGDNSISILSSDWVFYGCENLVSVNSSKIKISKFKGAFLGTKVPYTTAENLIDIPSSDSDDYEEQGYDFSYFYMQVQCDTQLDININTTKYPLIKKMDYMFSQNYYRNYFTWKTGVSSKRYNITINSNKYFKVNNVTSINSLFHLCGNINIPVEFIKKEITQDNWQSALGDITYANVTFAQCNLENIEILPNTSHNSMLEKLTGLTRAQAMFYRSTIKADENNYNLSLTNTKLAQLNGMFHSTQFGKTENETFTPYDIKIDDFISQLNSGTIDLQGCFYNSNAYIDSDFSINANTNEVKISGFMSYSSKSQSPETKLIYNNKFSLAIYNGGEDAGKVEYGINSINYGSTDYESYVSPFGNRTISNDTSTIEITGNKNLNYYFFGVNRRNNDVINIEIHNSNNITGICKNATNINIAFLTTNSCKAERAFEHCDFNNNNVSNISLTHITNANGMFAGSNIQSIPNNLCLPSTVEYVKSMFNQCLNLKGGLPTDFFTSAKKVKDISGMFYKTKIVSTGSIDNINKLNPIAFPDNIETAVNTFAKVKKTNEDQCYPIQIGGNNLNDATGICANMVNNDSIQVLLSGLKDSIHMAYAFVNRTVAPDGFNGLETSKIGDARGMFYSENINNLDVNIDISHIPSTTKTAGIFHNWKGHTDSDEIVDSLPSAYETESNWSTNQENLTYNPEWLIL